MESLPVVLLRKRLKGRSQAVLAKELGIKASYLSDILTGKRAPGPQVLDALGVERTLTYTARKARRG